MRERGRECIGRGRWGGKEGGKVRGRERGEEREEGDWEGSSEIEEPTINFNLDLSPRTGRSHTIATMPQIDAFQSKYYETGELPLPSQPSSLKLPQLVSAPGGSSGKGNMADLKLPPLALPKQENSTEE